MAFCILTLVSHSRAALPADFTQRSPDPFKRQCSDGNKDDEDEEDDKKKKRIRIDLAGIRQRLSPFPSRQPNTAVIGVKGRLFSSTTRKSTPWTLVAGKATNLMPGVLLNTAAKLWREGIHGPCKPDSQSPSAL